MGRYVFSLLVCLISISVYALLNSGLFFIDQMQWSGNQYVLTEELQRYSQFSPDNIFRIDIPGLRSNILQHPWVARADIRWKWPNRIQAEILERQPLALVPVSNGWFLLAPDGALLPPPLGLEIYSLPLVTAVDKDSVLQLQQAAEVLQALPVHVAESVSEWNSAEQALVTRQGCRILLGSTQDLAVKMNSLELVLHDVAASGVQPKTIDLRVPLSPAVKK